MFRLAILWAWRVFKSNPTFYTEIILTFFASWVILELVVIAGHKLGWIFNLGAHLSFLAAFSGLQTGFTHICLDVYDHRNPSYLVLFKSVSQGVKFLSAQFIFLGMVLIGLGVFILPGFYLAGKYAFFGFVLAERGRPILDSLRASAALTAGSERRMASYLVLFLLFNGLGAMFLGLGLCVTVPVSALAMTSLYQSLKTIEETR